MFSVIIPNYNRAEAVKVAINSVLNQTYQDFEVIVVDDCSTDNSVLEISKIKDPKLKILQLDKNSGAARARNYGVARANGELISFLDSDDYYEPEFLEESYKVISECGSEIGFMWTGVRYHYTNRTYDRSWTPPRKKNAYYTFLHNLQIGSGSGITLRKNAFLNCGGFNVDLPAAEDTAFFLKITQEYDYVNTNEILINVIKKGEDRMSKSFINIAKAYNKFLSQHFENINSDDLLKKKFYYKMMWLNYHLNNKKEARKFYKKIPGSFDRGKIKALFTKILYEFLPLEKASEFHQKISSL